MILLALLFAVGCGGAGDEVDASPGESDAAASDAQSSGVEGIIGGVQVSDRSGAPVWIWGFTEFSSPGMIFGIVGEGMWEVSISAGDCVYLSAIEPGFCEPVCDYDSYCDSDDTCQLWPVRVDAGEMVLEGLAQEVTMTPNENHYYPVPSDTPDVMFTGGESATLTAAGNQLPAFELATIAPDPLAEELDCDLALDPDEDLTVSWEPGSGASRVRWEMITMMHAGNGPMVLCESDDTGSLVVAAELIAAYLEDQTQWPTYQLSRYSRATAPVGGDRYVGLETVSTRYCFGTP